MTYRQKTFIDEFLIDMNMTQAAIRAGYSPNSARATASQLMKHPAVSAGVASAMAERSKRTGINQERIIMELARIGLLDPADLIDTTTFELKPDASADDRAALLSMRKRVLPGKPDELPGVEYDIRFADKIRALELLGKHLGLFADKFQIDAALPVVIVDDLKD